MKFRVHHILCTSLYRGYGYSGPFCENMTKLVSYLREHLEEPLTLVATPDAICKNCPNLNSSDFSCASDGNHVHHKDLELLKVLGLQENEQYTYRKLLEEGLKNFSQTVFEHSCHNCEWYQQGLCKYEDLVKSMKSLLDKSKADTLCFEQIPKELFYT